MLGITWCCLLPVKSSRFWRYSPYKFCPPDRRSHIKICQRVRYVRTVVAKLNNLSWMEPPAALQHINAAFPTLRHVQLPPDVKTSAKSSKACFLLPFCFFPCGTDDDDDGNKLLEPYAARSSRSSRARDGGALPILLLGPGRSRHAGVDPIRRVAALHGRPLFVGDVHWNWGES